MKTILQLYLILRLGNFLALPSSSCTAASRLLHNFCT